MTSRPSELEGGVGIRPSDWESDPAIVDTGDGEGQCYMWCCILKIMAVVLTKILFLGETHWLTRDCHYFQYSIQLASLKKYSEPVAVAS